MAFNVSAQVKFYTLVSENNLSPDQTFQVQFIIEGATRIQEFKNPSFVNFTIEEMFDVPNTPKINPQSLQLIDAYSKIAVLTPTKTGKFSIPGATAIIDGKFMRSNTVKVVVVKNNTQSFFEDESERVEDESEIKPGETISEKLKENFFLVSEVNKTSCYVGESLMAVYKACSRLNANSRVTKRPSLTGFSVMEMVDAYDAQATVEDIRGKPFYVHLIRKVQLFPLQPGVFELDGAEVESVIHFVKRNQLSAAELLQKLIDKSPAEPELTVIPHQVTLKTNPLTITVKPLPEQGQPLHFSGAVGAFSIKSAIEKNTLEQQSSVRVSFTISGTGNFPLVTSPGIAWPQSFEVTEDEITENTNAYVYPLSGTKTFSFLISVKDPGKYIIPTANFSYFDPQKKAYQTVYSSPVEVTVTKKTNRLSSILIPKDADPSAFSGFPRHYYWFGLVVLIIVSLIIYQVFFAGKRKKSTHYDNVQEPEETRRVFTKNPFASADIALMLEDRKKFYAQVQQELWDAAAEKCQVLPSALNKQNIAESLRSKSVSEEIIADFKYILNDCEWALYTPETTTADMILMRQRAGILYEKLVK